MSKTQTPEIEQPEDNFQLTGTDLIKQSFSALQKKAYTLGTNGIEFSSKATFEDWQEAGELINRVEGATAWWKADWLAYGQHKHGEKYAQAAELVGGDPDYLQQLNMVATKIPKENRNPNLSFSHHRRVVGCAPEEQKRFLDAAEKNGWSSSELYKRVKEWNDKARSKDGNTGAGIDPFRFTYPVIESGEDPAVWESKLRSRFERDLDFYKNPEKREEYEAALELEKAEIAERKKREKEAKKAESDAKKIEANKKSLQNILGSKGVPSTEWHVFEKMLIEDKKTMVEIRKAVTEWKDANKSKADNVKKAAEMRKRAELDARKADIFAKLVETGEESLTHDEKVLIGLVKPNTLALAKPKDGGAGVKKGSKAAKKIAKEAAKSNNDIDEF